MRTLLTTLLLLMASGLWAAEDAKEERRGFDPERHAEKHQQLLEELKLNEEQQGKFEEAMKLHVSKMQDIRETHREAKGDKERADMETRKESRAAWEEEHKRFNTELAGFLTADQMQIMQKHQREMQMKRMEGMEKFKEKMKDKEKKPQKPEAKAKPE